MQTKRTFVAVMCVLVAGLYGRAAFAQDDAEAKAKDSFEEGVSAFARGDYEQACERFEAAYRLTPMTSVLFNIGMSYRARAQHASAILYLEKFLAASTDQYPSLVTRASESLAQMRKRVGYLHVDEAPLEAVVAVNGRTLGPVSAGPFPLDLGLSSVRVEAPGHTPLEVRVLAEAGHVVRVCAPLPALDTLAGRSSLELETKAIPPEPVDPPALSVEKTAPTRGAQRGWAIATTSLAAGALVALVPLAVSTASLYQEARSKHDDYLEEPDSAHTAAYRSAASDAYRNLGITLAVAGTAAIVGVVSGVLWSASEYTQNKTVGQATVGWTWQGTSLTVRF